MRHPTLFALALLPAVAVTRGRSQGGACVIAARFLARALERR